MTRQRGGVVAGAAGWLRVGAGRVVTSLAVGRAAPDRGPGLAPTLGRLPAATRAAVYLGGALGIAGLGVALGASGSALVRAPTDFTIYYAGARALVAGGNPYDWHALRQMVPEVNPLGYVYPLWALVAFLPLAALPLDVAAGVWFAFNLACLAVSLVMVARLVGIAPRSRWLPGLFFATCCAIPGLFALLQGQIALPILLAVLGAAWAARRGRGGWAGALLAVALVKPQLTGLPILAVLVIASHRGILRASLLALGGVSAALLGASFALRPTWLGEWIAALHRAEGAGGTGTRALWANMGTVPALAAHLPGPLGVVLVVAAVIAGIVVLGVLAGQVLGVGIARPDAGSGVATLASGEPDGDEVLLLAGAILVGSVVTPWMWIYDGVLWLIPVAYAVARGPGWRRWGALAVFVLVPWIVRVAHVASTPTTGTSLNKLEDILVAPALLALVLIAPRHQGSAWARGHTTGQFVASRSAGGVGE